MLAMPMLSFAQSGLVRCGDTSNPCDTFAELMTLINTVIRFILFDMVIPIAAIMFAYAGFLMVTAGGSTEKVGKAKTIFTNVAIGVIIAVIAWLIISLILSILSPAGFWSWIGF